MNIKLVAFDVDGVLTDGSLTFDENGHEYKTFNAKDGQGIVNLNKPACFEDFFINANIRFFSVYKNLCPLKFNHIPCYLNNFAIYYNEVSYFHCLYLFKVPPPPKQQRDG